MASVLLDTSLGSGDPADQQPDVQHLPRGSRIRRLVGGLISGVGSGCEWLLGVASLVVGLSMLSATPLLQYLSLGYLLESSARVARTGRLRDGLIGVRPAARIGSVAMGIWVSLTPAWLLASYTRSAELILPDGPSLQVWRLAFVALLLLTLAHVGLACARGGRLRHFFLPFGNPFWLRRKLREGGLWRSMADSLAEFLCALRLPHYFRLGLLGFLGTLVWLIPPALLLRAGKTYPLVGLAGAVLLAVIVSVLPFLQTHFAVEGQFRALFSRRKIREQWKRAPWAFAFALMVLLLAAIPLYLLKIEMIAREAVWLESLVFVIFLAPARLLTGWAYARALRRETPRHWVFRAMGRLAVLPVALLYVLVVFLAQYTCWSGVNSLHEQHAFLLPAPFLDM